MKTKSLILIQVVLSAIIIFGYYLYVKNDSKNNKTELIVDKLENRENGEKLPDTFFTLLNNNNLNLEKSKLVFRFTEINCGTCVSREVRLIKKLANNVGWDRIIFLATNSNEKYLNRFKRVSQIKTDMINIGHDYFPMDKEWISTPYMFIIDSDSVYKNLFISIQENERRSEVYLEKVEKFLEG